MKGENTREQWEALDGGDGVLTETPGGFLLVQHCGSHWAGDAPDTLDTLLGMIDGDEKAVEYLGEQPTLSPSFEDCGDFISPATWIPARPDFPHCYQSFGNFENVSFAFSLFTDDEVLIERLIAAVQEHKKSDRYRAALAAERERQAKCAEFAEEHRARADRWSH
jgi:hypothetical protein